MSNQVRYADRECDRCHNAFTPTTARAKYCSDRCRYGEGVCETCGETFLRKKSTTGNFCSRKCWYAWPGRILNKECLACKQLFRPKDPSQTCCSVACANEAKRSDKRQTHCERCHKPLNRKCHVRVRFCSKRCALLDREGRGEEQPLGARAPGPNGYTLVKVGKGYPGAHKTGWMLEHRYVMEQQLGRPLEPFERVHHKFGDRSDNDPDRLELWIVRGRSKKDPAGQRLDEVVAQAAAEVSQVVGGEADLIEQVLREVFRLEPLA